MLNKVNIFDKNNSPAYFVKLPFYSAVILLACWVGNRNPENLDRKLFKDYKGKTSKNVRRDKCENMCILKSVKIDRLIALSQAILSQSDYLQKIDPSASADQ